MHVDREPDELDGAMARAWPDGVPEAETMIRARLDGGRADKLARRLDAVRRWTEGRDAERPGSAPEAAASAGLGVSQFHALSAAWRSRRSLSSLGVHAAERRPYVRAKAAVAGSGLIDVIGRLLAERPDLRPVEIRRALGAGEGLSIGDASLLRLIADARRRLPPGVFGRRLVLDSAGLDFVDAEGLRVRLYGVVDHGSGIVLGWAVGTDRSRSMGHFWSVSDALERLPRLRMRKLCPFDGDPVMDVRLHVEDVGGRGVFDAEFGRAPSLGRASRTLGSTLVSVLGERLDDIWLGTGERRDGIAYRTGQRIRIPEYTSAIAWTIDPAIERHNAGRLALAASTSSASDRATSRGRVGATLARVLRLEAAIRDLPDYVWVSAMERGEA